MKHYIFNGKTYDKLPDPFNGCSPMTDERFTSLGGTIEDDGEPTSFDAACAQFRALCAEIGSFIGAPEFKGGFDEYAAFSASDAYADDPIRGNALAIRWSALNELCKYEGAKSGLGQPAWWYDCWETEGQHVSA